MIKIKLIIVNIKKTGILALISIFSCFSCINAQSIKHGFKFGQFIDYLDNYYVDTVNAEQIVEDAIIGILENLDPHSTYIPADEIKKRREPLQGNFEGVGIQFNILNDTLYVISPISGGPSERVGVMAGDKIIKVDGENIAGVGLTNEDVFRLLRGKKGTEVTISVKRRNVTKFIDFHITRDKIPLYSVDASYMVDDSTGYIKINRFSATTIEEFKKAAIELKNKNARNLILDLTNNGGGYLDAAVKLADEFLQNQKLIVYTEGIHAPKFEYLATVDGNFEQGKVIILIDEGSASASEIVSGAVQDWDRGIVIGRRSFGKGLVQREMPLHDGSALRITVAKYYTPSGRLIQKPFDKGIDNYHREILNRYSNGELMSSDSINFPDSLKYKTLEMGRIVFGGGGIMPDIFVPFDTSFFSNYYRDIVRKGILNNFVLEYVDINRNKLLKDYESFSDYNEFFKIDEKLFVRFTSFAEKEGVKKNKDDLNVSKPQLDMMLKALIARNLFGNDEFFQIYNTTNKTYLKAIEVINTWNKYKKELHL